MVRRIHKLMALAESRNPNEAEAAMAKAHELIAKYNIDMLESAGTRDFVSAFAGEPALRHPRQDYHLANLLLDFYFVEGIWVPAYVVGKGKMGRVLEISGTAHNVEIAGYIHDFVKAFIGMQWARYRRREGLSHYRQTDFAVGIIEGLRAKLEAQQENRRADSRTSALVKVQDPQLRAYLAYRYPHTTRFARVASRQDDRVIEDGMRTGREMVISRALKERGRAGNRLIEHK